MRSLSTRTFKLPVLTALICALALICAGCAAMYVNPGPQPARVRVLLEAKSDMAEFKAAMADEIRGYHYGLDTFGPFWEWGLYLKADDGSLKPLRPEKSGSVTTEEGFSFEKDVTFLVPPGQVKLWLLLDVYLDYFEPGWGGGPNPVNIKTYTEDIKADLCPGCEMEIKRSLGKFKPRRK